MYRDLNDGGVFQAYLSILGNQSFDRANQQIKFVLTQRSDR